MEEWNRGRWVFNDIHGLGFPYWHIHPYKQKAVKQVVDCLRGLSELIIVFGSSVSPWHFYEKDLDLCLVGITRNRYTGRKDLLATGVEIDILFYENLEKLLQNSSNINSVEHSIVRNGVCVYDRESNAAAESRRGLEKQQEHHKIRIV